MNALFIRMIESYSTVSSESNVARTLSNAEVALFLVRPVYFLEMQPRHRSRRLNSCIAYTLITRLKCLLSRRN